MLQIEAIHNFSCGGDMKEIFRTNLNEVLASRYLPDDCGERVYTWEDDPDPEYCHRRIVTEVGSPEYKMIGEAYRKAQPDYLFFGWSITRKYTKREIAAAEIFHFRFRRGAEICGELTDTKYDTSKECVLCRGGGVVIPPLKIDVRKFDKGYDLIGTHTGEWLISEHALKIFQEHDLRGFEVRPVEYEPYVAPDEPDLEKTPSGRKFLELRAERVDNNDAVQSAIFFHTDPGRWLYQQAEREHLEMFGESARIKRTRTRARNRPAPPLWYEVVIPRVLNITSKCVVGENPFIEEDACRCAFAGQAGHSLGQELISVLNVNREGWQDVDIACTRQLVGLGEPTGRRYFRPEPLIVISPRFRQAILDNTLKGSYMEVARFA